MQNNKVEENAGFLTYKNIIFAIMLILVLIFLSNIADIAIMLFVAFIITCAIDPSVKFLEKYMPRVLAVSLVFFLLLIGILLIFIPLLTLTIKQGIVFIKHLPEYIQNLQIFLHTNHFGILLSKYINPDAISTANTDIANVTGEILSKGADISKLIVSSITSSIAVAIMVFYLSYDEKLMKKRFLEFFPPKFKEKAEYILDSIKTKVGGYVFAQVLSMAVVHKRCDCSRCIKFTVILLQTFQQCFINIVERMSFVIIRKINFIKYVKKLPEKDPIFHKIRRFPH